MGISTVGKSRSRMRLESANLRWRIRQLHNQGLSTSWISKLLGLCHDYVRRVINGKIK